MTDDNPTELETFQILEEAQKKLKLAVDPEHSKFMSACISGGKSAIACAREWNDKHKKAEMSAEMQEYVTFIDGKMKDGKTLAQSVEDWKEAHKLEGTTIVGKPTTPDELKPLMSRLEALENLKKEEIKVQLSALVVEVKKVDPSFDEKKFMVPFADNTPAAMQAVSVYMETVKHFKETLPELQTQMHLGTNDAIVSHRKELTKAMFGTEDVAKIVKEL